MTPGFNWPEVAQILRQNDAQLLPDLVRTKYVFMAENAFRFFRGSNQLFFTDLLKEPGLPASPNTWVCGDLHLENFGSYRSDNRQVYFDLNDFDEAGLGPALFDLVRMTTSIFVAFGSLKIEDKKARSKICN